MRYNAALPEAINSIDSKKSRLHPLHNLPGKEALKGLAMDYWNNGEYRPATDSEISHENTYREIKSPFMDISFDLTVNFTG